MRIIYLLTIVLLIVSIIKFFSLLPNQADPRIIILIVFYGIVAVSASLLIFYIGKDKSRNTSRKIARGEAILRTVAVFNVTVFWLFTVIRLFSGGSQYSSWFVILIISSIGALLVARHQYGNLLKGSPPETSGISMMSGGSLADILVKQSANCIKCNTAITFEDGASFAVEHNQQNAVMCGKCNSIYEVELTPNRMRLTREITKKESPPADGMVPSSEGEVTYNKQCSVRVVTVLPDGKGSYLIEDERGQQNVTKIEGPCILLIRPESLSHMMKDPEIAARVVNKNTIQNYPKSQDPLRAFSHVTSLMNEVASLQKILLESRNLALILSYDPDIQLSIIQTRLPEK